MTKNSDQEKVYLVTGVAVAVDNDDELLIAGILSDSPFGEKKSDSSSANNLVGSFAFTKNKAKFLRDRLNEFLQEE